MTGSLVSWRFGLDFGRPYLKVISSEKTGGLLNSVFQVLFE